MHVQNLGYPLPLQIGCPKTTFLQWTTSQLNSNFNGLYLRNKTRWNRSSALQTTRVSYIVSKRHELWSTNGLKLDRGFTHRRRSANGTQPNFANRWTVIRAEKSAPEKSGSKNLLHLFGFSTTSRLSGEYLLNETWHRQSGKGVGKHQESPTLSKNFMNFGPQTA